MKDRAYQFSIGILVIIIIVLAWALIATKSASQSPSAMTTQSAASSSAQNMAQGQQGATSTMRSNAAQPQGNQMISTGADTISASNQPAGESVMVDSVTVGQPSWIAVRESSGSVLGAALVGTGTHSSVEVPLLRGTTAGQQYQLLLYADDGDKQFDLHKDSLIMSADGSVAGTTFNAQ